MNFFTKKTNDLNKDSEKFNINKLNSKKYFEGGRKSIEDIKEEMRKLKNFKLPEKEIKKDLQNINQNNINNRISGINNIKRDL